jgi:hypothetical protein
MNAEQAYIEGFVKRAMEYGFSENEAEALFKEASRGAQALNLIGKTLSGKKPINPRANRMLELGLAHAPERHTFNSKQLADKLRSIRTLDKYVSPGSFNAIENTARGGQNLMTQATPHPFYSPNQTLSDMATHRSNMMPRVATPSWGSADIPRI